MSDSVTLIKMSVYVVSVLLSMYALTSIKFDELCHVRNPRKVQLLLILLSIGLGYLVGQFILEMFIYR